MPTKLSEFIIEARKRGFSDIQIRKSLKENGWPAGIVNSTFKKLQPKFKIKNQVCVFLSDEILKVLQKRAKKNMFTLSEQIEDILRRSSIRKSKSKNTEKIDDLLLKIFSRSSRGRKKK